VGTIRMILRRHVLSTVPYAIFWSTVRKFDTLCCKEVFGKPVPHGLSRDVTCPSALHSHSDHYLNLNLIIFSSPVASFSSLRCDNFYTLHTDPLLHPSMPSVHLPLRLAHAIDAKFANIKSYPLHMFSLAPRSLYVTGYRIVRVPLFLLLIRQPLPSPKFQLTFVFWTFYFDN